MARTSDAKAGAAEHADLFPAVYLRFHRRDGKRRALTGASLGILRHLAGAGPLTIRAARPPPTKEKRR